MNKKQNKKGYLAIEAVIVSAVVLLAGIASLMPFSSRMLDARTKLMDVFGDSLVSNEQLNDDRFTDVIRSGDFEFLDLGDSYRVITYLNELNKTVIIPGEYNGKEVTEIGGWVFASMGIESVEIPNSIRVIDEGAFYENELINVNLSTSLESINALAFGNNKITGISLPAELKTIGESSFVNNRLSSIDFNEGLIHIGDSAFSGNLLTSINLPNSLKEIGAYAFMYNFINYLNVPNGVQTIHGGAFSNNSIATVILGEGVSTIESGVFSNNSINTLILNGTVTAIRDGAFSENKLTTITIPASINELGTMAFAHNPLSSVTFTGAIPTELGYDIFKQHDELLTINSINVPLGQLEAYQLRAYENFGTFPDAFYE